MEENRNDDRLMTGRFYTSARRFKQVLGSLPDGTKIPGGPYTYTQIGVMVGTLIAGWITRGVWGSGSAVGDLVLLVAIAVGAGFIVGKMPASRRSPLRLLGSIFALLSHPGPGGRWRGRPLKLSRKAQKLQREQKNAAKAAARAAKKKATKAPVELQPAPEEPRTVTPMPAGYGSTLHLLLADDELLETERKN